LAYINNQYQKLKTKTFFHSKDINQIQRAHFFSKWQQHFDYKK
jgi:hypothetical protein